MNELEMRFVVLAIAAAAAGCSSRQGELALAIQTDMAAPKDVDTIELQVESGGTVIFSQRFQIGPGETALPATQGLLVSEDDPSREIRARVRAFRREEVRVEHAVVTTVPEERAATLWLPLSFLCSSPGGGGEAKACAEGETCVAGECRSSRVGASELPDYATEQIFGDGACFDVARCFEGAEPAKLTLDGCWIEAGDGVNVALASEGEGFCGVSGCSVPLDAESELGWRRDAATGRLKLPDAVCGESMRARLAWPQVVVAPVSASCPKKTSSLPVCRKEQPALSPIAVAAWQRNPVSLVVGKGEVFWTEQGTLPDPSDPAPDGNTADGAVKGAALEGGATLTLASGLPVPRDLALDPAKERLFWTHQGRSGNGELKWLELDQPAPDIVTLRPSLSSPEGVSSNGDLLFWTEFPLKDEVVGRVVQAQRDGRQQQDVRKSEYPFRVASTKSDVCWTDWGRGELGAVWCQRLESGETVALGTEEKSPMGLVIDSEGEPPSVLWANFGNGEGPGQIVRRARDAGAREVLFEGPAGPHGIAVDRERIYWTNRREGTVMALPKTASPGAAPEELASGQLNPGAIAVVDGVLFWVNEGSSERGNGAVVRLSTR